MQQVAISIVVPVYRVPERFLRKCIESIKKQTLKDIEILLVDDGSPDNCGSICDEYAKTDKRIKVIHKKNGGLSSARNAGFVVSEGKWIMFVDGDDWIEPDMCEVMVKLGNEKSTQLVMCGMTKEYGRSSFKYKYCLEENKVYSGDECKWLQEQLLHFNSNIAVAYCKLISKELLASNGIMHNEELRQGAEGLEFNLRLFEKLERAVFVNRAFYHYIYNDNSISASHNQENHELVIKCFESIKGFIESSENAAVLMPWFYNRLLYVIITTAISGYFNPSNKENYLIKRKKYQRYLNHAILKEALRYGKKDELSNARKIILWLIKHRMYLAVNCIAVIRKYQKSYI